MLKLPQQKKQKTKQMSSHSESSSQESIEIPNSQESKLLERLNTYILFKSAIDTAKSGYEIIKTKSEYAKIVLDTIEGPITTTVVLTHNLLDSTIHVDDLACKALDVNDSVLDYCVDKKDKAKSIIVDTKDNARYYWDHTEELVENVSEFSEMIVDKSIEAYEMSKDAVIVRTETGKRFVVDTFEGGVYYVSGIGGMIVETTDNGKKYVSDKISDSVDFVHEKFEGTVNYGMEKAQNVKDLVYFCE